MPVLRLMVIGLTSLLGVAFAQEQRVSLGLGEPAPPIKAEEIFQTSSNEKADLESLKGKVVVLDFWATWCGPCVAAIPHLNGLVSTFRDKPVQFLFLTDEERWRVKRFLKIRPIAGWIGLNPSRSTFQRFGVEGLPRTIVIDHQGRIAADIGPEDLNENLIEDVLNGKEIRPTATKVTTVNEDISPVLLEMLIRPAKPGQSARKTANEITTYGARLLDILSLVYSFSKARIIAPSPLAESTYDVSFIVPLEKKDALAGLAGRTLETAFGLKAARETQERDLLVLSAPHGNSSLRRSTDPRDLPILSDVGQVASKSTTLKDFCSVLEATLERPVLDDTGIQGLFDIALYWDSNDPRSVVQAVHDQLGLDLAPEKRSIEVMVVTVPTT